MDCCVFGNKLVEIQKISLKEDQSVIKNRENQLKIEKTVNQLSKNHENYKQETKISLQVTTSEFAELSVRDNSPLGKQGKNQQNSEKILKNRKKEEPEKLNSEPIPQKKVSCNQNNQSQHKQSTSNQIQQQNQEYKQIQFFELSNEYQYGIQQQTTFKLQDCQIIWSFSIKKGRQKRYA